MAKEYPINEIFYSLQGEGHHTGVPAIFVRFSGCNRRCAFCDTDFSASTPMSVQEIVESVSKYPAKVVIITGGEPLLSIDDDLCKALHAAGKRIHVETNGSLPVPDGVDWVTCSPKDKPWNINRLDELKVVYQGQDVESILQELKPRVDAYLQPCSCVNTKQVIDYILEHPWWNLSLQTHKMIDIK